MTVTWVDVPGSKLASLDDAVDFTASTDVLALSIELGGGLPEERAYRDGAFVAPYTASSREGATFHLRRAGGWLRRIDPRTGKPYPLKVYVDEAPPAFSSTWSTLYERDLRTLPSQTIQASLTADYKAFVMDGQPWYFHGSSGYAMQVNGQGLVVGAQGYAHSGNPYAGCHVGLRVYAMQGYDPTKEVAVQLRLAGSPLYTGEVGAAWWSANETWGYGPGADSNTVRWLRSGNGSGNTNWGGSTTVANDAAPFTYDDWAFAIASKPFLLNAYHRADRNYRSGYFKRGLAGGADALPTMESMQPAGSWNGLGLNEGPNFKMGLYCGTWSSNGYTLETKVTHVRVLQRAA